MVVKSLLLIVCGYLLGSVPSAYLAGRWLKGIDLRRFGSGTVSGSMVWEHVAHWAVLPVGLFDIFKAGFPVWLGLHLRLPEAAAILAGLAAMIGHNWSLYLGFTGGRGLSPFLGVLLVVFPWGVPWLLVFLAIGYLLGDSAPWALLSLLLLPLFNRWMNGPTILDLAVVCMLLLTVIKRLEANRRPLPEDGAERRAVLFRRLFFDRDIASHRDWINRRS